MPNLLGAGWVALGGGFTQIRALDNPLENEVVVEVKVDGANVGLSLGAEDQHRAQNRGSYISCQHRHSQFGPLFQWMAAHEAVLRDALPSQAVLFGEWCYAVHSIPYATLPDRFLAFDVYDRSCSRFYAFLERATGRGYATEAAAALAAYAFAPEGADRADVVSAVDAPNTASVRVLEKCGFARTGEIPGAFGPIVLFRLARP